MSMSALIGRLLQLVPVLLGVSVIVFAMIALTPGDPVQLMIGDQAVTAEQEATLRHDLGLDRPVIQRFFLFIGNAVQGDFGQSFYHRRPVADVIVERLPATIELSLVALIVALVTAIPLGVLAAIRKNSILDKLATVGSLLGVSLPGFWFGILLIMLFAVNLHILPVSGRIGYSSEIKPITHFLLIDTLLRGNLPAFWDALKHIILPAVTLGLPMTAILMRVTRASMLEVLRQDYVTFAEAKGLTRTKVLFRHALKNALIPTVSVAAIETGSLLGGNMIIETVFGWPGLGRLVFDALLQRDLPLLLGVLLVSSVVVVLVNLLVDLLYGLLDPRIVHR